MLFIFSLKLLCSAYLSVAFQLKDIFSEGLPNLRPTFAASFLGAVPFLFWPLTACTTAFMAPMAACIIAWVIALVSSTFCLYFCLLQKYLHIFFILLLKPCSVTCLSEENIS